MSEIEYFAASAVNYVQFWPEIYGINKHVYWIVFYNNGKPKLVECKGLEMGGGFKLPRKWYTHIYIWPRQKWQEYFSAIY